MNRIGSPCISVTPSLAAILVIMPPWGAVTRCSIFMDSITAICWPGRTRSPSLTSIATTVPCRGAGIASDPAGPATAPLATGVGASAPAVADGKEQRMRVRLRGFDQRGNVAVDEARADAVGDEIGVSQHRLQERNVGLDAADAEFA